MPPVTRTIVRAPGRADDAEEDALAGRHVRRALSAQRRIGEIAEECDRRAVVADRRGASERLVPVRRRRGQLEAHARVGDHDVVRRRVRELRAVVPEIGVEEEDRVGVELRGRSERHRDAGVLPEDAAEVRSVARVGRPPRARIAVGRGKRRPGAGGCPVRLRRPGLVVEDRVAVAVEAEADPDLHGLEDIRRACDVEGRRGDLVADPVGAPRFPGGNADPHEHAPLVVDHRADVRRARGVGLVHRQRHRRRHLRQGRDDVVRVPDQADEGDVPALLIVGNAITLSNSGADRPGAATLPFASQSKASRRERC